MTTPPSTAKLILPDGKETTLPVLVGSENEHAIDIRALRQDTGYITLDSGYMNTGSTTSAITYLDGEKGILRYRGYAIEDLAEKSDFVETSYLLIYGKLPNKAERFEFGQKLTRHSLIH
jgi:citrate synthase